MKGCRVCSKSRVFSLRTLQNPIRTFHEHKPLLKSNSKVLQQDVHGRRLPWAFWGWRMVSNTVSIEGEKLPRPPGFRTDKASNALHSLQRTDMYANRVRDRAILKI